MILYSMRDLLGHFDPPTFSRGRNYQSSRYVTNLNVVDDGSQITALVKGSRKNAYQVSVEIGVKEGNVDIEGYCTCPMAYNCKHVAAVLLEAFETIRRNFEQPKDNTSASTIEGKAWLSEILQRNHHGKNDFEYWLKNIDSNLKSENTVSVANKSKHNLHLLYLLDMRSYGQPAVKINLRIARRLKKGGYGIDKQFSCTSNTHYDALLPMDHDILHRLEVAKRSSIGYSSSLYGYEYELSHEFSVAIFKDILKTERAFWISYENAKPLRLGAAKTGLLAWELEESGEQKMICQIEGRKIIPLPLNKNELWYLDVLHEAIGPLEIGPDPKLLKLLLFAPKVPPKDAENFAMAMKNRLKVEGAPAIPIPYQFEKIQVKEVKPKAKLRLYGIQSNHYFFYRNFGKSLTIPLGRLSFIYDRTEISLDMPATVEILDSETRVLKTISRQFEEEVKYIDFLLQQGVSIFSKKYVGVQIPDIKNLDLLIGELGHKTSQETFIYQTVPQLRTLGWDIIVEQSFPVEYLIKADEWYSEIQENKTTDWFNMELGFLLNGQKVNILPLLVNFIRQYPEKFSEVYLKDLTTEQFIITLPEGQKVQIPNQRVKGILAILTELYDDKSLDKSGKLTLSRLRAAQVLELEKMMEITRLRWLGGEKLIALNHKLNNFKGIKPVKIPETFKGQLRDYQKHGVDWLSFLKEYQLGGILSDDMGLGKTVQTLAHILVEKEEGRLSKPCLVVAPTSLMSNWRLEAVQFSPSLTVLVLQGQSRKQLFGEIKKADIVLTTYPLLVRDQEALLEHDYDMIILDEAQNVKNAQTKAYQILQQLRASHRLCLTGTPMENHLGELWSLFNFLSPGLLGDSKQFSQIFRVPIEKQGNTERRLSLLQRIHPYMLRRTKREVIKELPPKTEIIHNIMLEDAQRDLYESIRLAMESKIRKVIELKGLSGSQIIILDALLKLRQTCCDPRLLKLEQAKKVKESAKLRFLMDMVTELLEEGHKILLFSSFTSMLTLIEEELNKQKITYAKLTGSTLDRATPIRQFQQGEVPIFLISLKAGGTGLNLTAADTVIHYDPWWNPAAETQATDRAHRIGQTKPVFVYKLVTTGTVEEKILLMQNKKKALLDSLFEEKQTSKMGLTKEDLNFLFQPLEDLKK